MPILCYESKGWVINSRSPIEAGEMRTYHCDPEEIGAVVLTGCLADDRGGRIYFAREEDLPYLVDEDDEYQQDKLDEHEMMIISTGSIASATISKDGVDIYTLLFHYVSPN